MEHKNVTVGTSAAPLGTSSDGCSAGLKIMALSTNIGSVFIGSDTNVTTGNGYELRPGDSEDFSGWSSPPQTLEEVYAIRGGVTNLSLRILHQG